MYAIMHIISFFSANMNHIIFEPCRWRVGPDHSSMSRVAKTCIHVPRMRDEFKNGFVELSLRSSLFGPVSMMVLIISIKGRHIALEKSGERVSMSSISAV